jgi:glycosyltransferase involved in cell wall biosynthesis
MYLRDTKRRNDDWSEVPTIGRPPTSLRSAGKSNDAPTTSGNEPVSYSASRSTADSDACGLPAITPAGGPAVRVLMLGKGWFPSQLGGLDRYYRDLLERLPEARGVVVGPVEDASSRVVAASEHSARLPVRLLAFARAARRQGAHADLVDAHFAFYALLPLITGILRKKPLLVHFHGPWADENMSVGDGSRLRYRVRRRLERLVYRRAQRIVTLTGAFRRVLVERYGVSPWKTEVLAPGVDLERFSVGDRLSARARFGLDPDAFVVCCARRLVPRMGIDVLLDAWSRGLRDDRRARLLLAGDGELRDELAQLIEARALTNSVTLLGRVNEGVLVELYKAADVNVVPSISHEGFGLVVLEAAACGTPSIVTRAGGLPEAIAGLGPDLTVPIADAERLAERLVLAQRGELPTRSHTRIWAEAHGWERVVDAHRMLFERVSLEEGTPPRKLRVVYLDHVAQLSGGELALLRLLTVLSGVEAHVILAEDGPLVDRLLQAGISVEVMPLAHRTRALRKDSVQPGGFPPQAGFDTIVYSLRLARRLRQLRPDAVHANSLKSGVYGSIAGRMARVPVLWHVRDRIEPDYLPPPAVTFVRFLTRHLPTVVVCNSEATKRTLRPSERAVVISMVDLVVPNGKTRQARQAGPLVVGIIGRLAPWKGQDVFLHAFARAFPAGKALAVVVGAPLFGEEEEAYADSLHRLANDLGIENRVDFRGHRDDIAQELHEMDILVHASTIPEPFGQVVIEGMSACLPVVASRDGGPEEIITDGVDGLLHPRGDVSALAQILERLGGDPELRDRLGRAAAQRAKDFAPDAVAQKVMETYKLALRPKRSRNRATRWPGRFARSDSVHLDKADP